MARPARVSPDRILAAAALEFAERGYAGARVDRIARRARVNKAMLYYHFNSKQTLYRELLRQTFARAGARIDVIARSDAPSGEKLARAIRCVAEFVNEHSFFPAIMLREIAEGGANLDRDTLAALATVPKAGAAIFQAGVKDGTFRPVHPLAAYFSMFAPIVFFMAGSAIRKELASRRLTTGSVLTPEMFLDHMEELMTRGLAARPTP